MQKVEMEKHFVVIGEEAMCHKKAMDEAISEKIAAENSSRDSKVKLIKITKDCEEKIAFYTSKLSSAEAEFENSLKTLKDEHDQIQTMQTDEIFSLKSRIGNLEEEVQGLLFSESSLQQDLELEKSRVLENEEQLAKLNATIEELESRISKKELETSEMIKDLQDQLENETLRAKDLDADLKAARDELRSMKVRKNSRGHSAGTLPSISQSHAQFSSTVRLKTVKDHSSLSEEDIENLMTSSAPSKITLVHHEGEEKDLHSDDVQSLISKKFTMVQKEKFLLQEKIDYLEESMQNLHAELEKKKSIINNILKRIEAGHGVSSASSTIPVIPLCSCGLYLNIT
jgi:ParB-like chromosome segregation protein Spo0J